MYKDSNGKFYTNIKFKFIKFDIYILIARLEFWLSFLAKPFDGYEEVGNTFSATGLSTVFKIYNISTNFL